MASTTIRSKPQRKRSSFFACGLVCLRFICSSIHVPRDRHNPPLTSLVPSAFTKHRGSWCKPIAVRSPRRAPGSAWRASSTPPFGCGATSIVLALLQCLLFRTKTTSSKVLTRAAFMSATCARCNEKADTSANMRAAPVLRCCGSAPLSLDPTLALHLASQVPHAPSHALVLAVMCSKTTRGGAVRWRGIPGGTRMTARISSPLFASGPTCPYQLSHKHTTSRRATATSTRRAARRALLTLPSASLRREAASSAVRGPVSLSVSASVSVSMSLSVDVDVDVGAA